MNLSAIFSFRRKIQEVIQNQVNQGEGEEGLRIACTVLLYSLPGGDGAQEWHR